MLQGFKMQTSLLPSVCRAFLGCQLEKAVGEPNLSRKIISCHPSNLPLPDHVDRFVVLNRSPSRLKFSEAFLGIHSAFDGTGPTAMAFGVDDARTTTLIMQVP
jgi:hypothetical protein